MKPKEACAFSGKLGSQSFWIKTISLCSCCLHTALSAQAPSLNILMIQLHQKYQHKHICVYTCTNATCEPAQIIYGPTQYCDAAPDMSGVTHGQRPFLKWCDMSRELI